MYIILFFSNAKKDTYILSFSGSKDNTSDMQLRVKKINSVTEITKRHVRISLNHQQTLTNKQHFGERDYYFKSFLDSQFPL